VLRSFPGETQIALSGKESSSDDAIICAHFWLFAIGRASGDAPGLERKTCGGHSMHKRLCAFVVQIVVIAFTLEILGEAQTTSGLITGTITDQSGAVLPGAHLVLTNQATGAQRNSVTDSNGHYIIPELQPGAYTVSVTKEGFATER
jgi:hypothetical protein